MGAICNANRAQVLSWIGHRAKVDNNNRCLTSKHALKMYDRSVADCSPPSVFQAVSSFKKYAKLKDKDSGCSLHSQLATNSTLMSNMLVVTALVDMYAKFNMLSKAQDMFDKAKDRDVVLWNALISGYAQQGKGAEALKYFEQMKSEDSIPPDEVTFACSLKACGILKDICKGEEIHSEVDKRGLVKSSQMVGNSLVDMYAKCGSLVKAQQVFKSLSTRNLISWNALISGYAQNEHSEEALNYFDQLQSQELAADAVTFACVLKACGAIGAKDKGQELHAKIEKLGSLKGDCLVGNALVGMYGKFGMLDKARQLLMDHQNRDVVSWNALIAGYVQHDRSDKALNCFEHMQRQGLPATAVTFACCLKACGSMGATEKSKEIHAHLEDSGLLQKNQVVGNALVDVYAKCGELAKAQEVFDTLPSRNVVSWNTLITGYAQVGALEGVLINLERMNEDGIDPNPVTFRVVLNACRHGGLVDKGQTYFEAMSQSYGISMLAKHQACMVDLLTRAGQTNMAMAMMKEAPSLPNSVMWLTVLSACRKCGNKDLGDKAFEQAGLLGQNQASAYVTLFNVYAENSIT